MIATADDPKISTDRLGRIVMRLRDMAGIDFPPEIEPYCELVAKRIWEFACDQFGAAIIELAKEAEKEKVK